MFNFFCHPVCSAMVPLVPFHSGVLVHRGSAPVPPRLPNTHPLLLNLCCSRTVLPLFLLPVLSQLSLISVSALASPSQCSSATLLPLWFCLRHKLRSR